MHERNYEAIARLLSQNPEPIALMNGLADIFEADNPRFDRERFLKACMAS